MDFFERQDRARRHTGLLVLYLLVAVALIAAGVNVVVYLVAVSNGYARGGAQAWLAKPIWLYVSGATFAVILIGSLRRWLALRGGGRAVAEMVAARPLDPGSHDPGERRLINVVEEMAIASGVPVPALYVMDDEAGINAFVAGYRPTEAVMVVTRGAIDTLGRDQLQGVVGHEYSHLLNGDMRLNVRLIALLGGILALGTVGRTLLRSGYSGRRRRAVSSRSSGNQLALIGFGLFVIGYIGVFFGNLIKAAVSRQREFLADASSVQFTRNPDGIAGALWRIREYAAGSLLEGPRTEETSHMCFAASAGHFFERLMATHPPLEERIRAVAPRFIARQAGVKARVARPAAGAVPRAAAGLAPTPPAIGASAAGLAASIGTVRPEQVTHAARLIDDLPVAVREALRSPIGAVSLIYALLFAEVAPPKARVALALLVHQTDRATAARAAQLQVALKPLGAAARLPILDLAMPSLRRLDAASRRRLLDASDKLVRIDARITLFELVAQTLLDRRLASAAGAADRVRYRRYEPVLGDVRRLLSLIARAGSADPLVAEAAFARAAMGFGHAKLGLTPPSACKPADMRAILGRLSGLAMVLKRPLIEACAECVLFDGKVTIAEGELLRAVAAALDCPMPPLRSATDGSRP